VAVKTSVLPELGHVLCDGLKARLPAWAGIQIASAHLGKKVTGDFFFLIGHESLSEPVTGGGTHTHYEEEGTIAFECQVERAGGGEAKAREVELLSAALMADLDKFLVSDQGVTGLVMQSHVSRKKRHNYIAEGSAKGIRGCLVEGTIAFKARLTPGG